MHEQETYTTPIPAEQSHTRRWYVLAALGMCALLLVLYSAITVSQRDTITQEQAYESIASPSVVRSASVTAHSAFVFDTATGEVLFEKNAYAQVPLASLTKIMLASVVADELARDAVVVITDSALLPEGDSGFVAGDVWRAGELLDFTLMTSSNDGATALAETIGYEETLRSMNERARAFGMQQTYFLNVTGLDEDEAVLSGAYGSAHDVAQLVEYLLATHPGVADATVWDEYTFTDMSGRTFSAENTNKVLHAIPGLIAGKTGYTDLAGGNLAVAFEVEPGHTIVAVVLGSTQNGRFADMRTLVDLIAFKAD